MIGYLTGWMDRFLGWLAPPIGMYDVLTPNDLADVEAHLDVWEPQTAAPATPRAGAVTPADAADAAPTSDGVSPKAPRPLVVSVGGPLKSDEQVIEELVADYREFVRDCFKKRRG